MFILYALASLIIGLVIGVVATQSAVKAKEKKILEDIDKSSREAKSKAEEILRKADLDGKELLYKLRIDFDKQHASKKEEHRVQRADKPTLHHR